MEWQMMEKVNPETVMDTASLSPLQSVLRKECLRKAYSELGKLPRREVNIFMMRSDEGRTREEVRGSVVNPSTGKPVSVERVRQLESRALSKVRDALVAGGYGLE